MDFEQMIATVRHNLMVNYQTRVRRSRRFEVYLADPTTFDAGLLVPLNEFCTMFESSIGKVFRTFDACRVFPPTTLHGYLAGRMGEVDLRATIGWSTEWEVADASLERWRKEYIAVSGDVVLVRLTGDAYEDAAFWWWLMCGGLMTWAVFSRNDGVGRSAEFLAQTFDPMTVEGEGDSDWAAPLTFAKTQTARSDRTCLLVHPNNLYASVVGSGSTVAALFKRAVHECTLTRRLWALR